MRPRPPRSRRCCCTGGWSRGGGRSACNPLPALHSSGHPGTRPTDSRCRARRHGRARRPRTPRRSRCPSRLGCARSRRSWAWRSCRRCRSRWRSPSRRGKRRLQRSRRRCRRSRGLTRYHSAGRPGTLAERSAVSPEGRKARSRSLRSCCSHPPRRSASCTGLRSRRRSLPGSGSRPSSSPPRNCRPSSDASRSPSRRCTVRSSPA